MTARTPWGPLDELIGGSLPPGCEDGTMMGQVPRESWIPRALELLHVHHVVSADRLDHLPGTRALTAPEGARFETADPRPVALLSPRVAVADDLAEAEAMIFGTDLDLRGSAVVLAPGPDLPDRPGGAVAVEVVDGSPGRWTLEVPAGGGLLTVAERHHAGWTAVDGQGRRLITVPANLTMLGVVVPDAGGRVELRFAPPDLGRGLAGAALALLVMLGLGTWAVFRGRGGAPRRSR